MAYLGFCPPGVVFPYAGATAPDGWLLCDGSAISRTTYAALFAAISTAHGTGDGSTTFNIPDYRGRFLRGRDGGAARDPDRAGRTASGTGGNTGDNVGSVEGNATNKNGLAVSGGTASLTGAVSNTPAGLTGGVTGGTASLTGTTTFSSSGHQHEVPIGTSDQLYISAKYGFSGNNTTNATGNAQGATGTIGTITMMWSNTPSGTAAVGISSTGASNGTLAATGGTAGNGTLAVSNTAASINTGDAETRPVNINVNYIIKI